MSKIYIYIIEIQQYTIWYNVVVYQKPNTPICQNNRQQFYQIEPQQAVFIVQQTSKTTHRNIFQKDNLFERIFLKRLKEVCKSDNQIWLFAKTNVFLYLNI